MGTLCQRLGPFGAAYFCAVYAIALCFAAGPSRFSFDFNPEPSSPERQKSKKQNKIVKK